MEDYYLLHAYHYACYTYCTSQTLLIMICIKHYGKN